MFLMIFIVCVCVLFLHLNLYITCFLELPCDSLSWGYMPSPVCPHGVLSLPYQGSYTAIACFLISLPGPIVAPTLLCCPHPCPNTPA